ncbi:MAG: hypothetical protein M3220_09520, partial [Chloroflexota bacterium]|nr:hypothetical protein [Chloroflexota bacterium]
RGSIHLSEGEALVDLLQDLRGRLVRIRVGGEEAREVSGTVVGLDIGEKYPFLQGRLSLLTDDGVQVLRLREVVAVELLDTQARTDLDFFLHTSVAEPEQRTVTLHLSDGDHDLVVRYLVPSPTWRVSYRFVGEKEEGGDEQRHGLLQGWGIFDNPFDESLEGVQVSLVSGMPISFIYDLYTPFTPERPEVKEQARVVAAPVEMERAPRAAPKEARSARAMAPDEAVPMAVAMSAPAPALRESLERSTAVAAQGEAQGERFEYRIAQPVTVQRGEAAMVPILGTDVAYRKEYIYNGRKVPRHPSVVLRFDNRSALTLERGPITVLEDGKYLGEAIFPFTRPNAEVLLAIAVDLGVSVREERHTSREMYQVTVQKGFLVLHQYTTVHTTYEIRNSNPEPLTLLVEHPRTPDFELLPMVEPVETTEEHYRWQVDVPAGPDGHETFTVRERRLEQSRQQLSSLTPATLNDYLRNRWLDEALANELGDILRLQAEKQRLTERLQEIEQERQRQVATQEQARKNMSGLKESGQEGELRARYVRQLNASEDTLATLEAERDRLRAEEEQLEKQIQEAIAALG